MAVALSEADMRTFIASRMDADLQFVLDEAGMEVRYQYAVGQVHTSLRRFQAAADDRAGMRALANTDFGIPADTPAGRAQVSATVAAWEAAKDMTAKEREVRAEAKVLGQPRVLQVHERQAMLRAVSTLVGELNEGETPSAEYREKGGGM